ncbi:hypothetical protein [Sorangium sp. So ce233]|uniref:hypothetical protein n=1 Tax=Sorangium sp. So ce233 TaxID=3133290 RepID=UPI003F61A264
MQCELHPKVGQARWAALLNDGRVLVVGGMRGYDDHEISTAKPLASAEVYDPATRRAAPERASRRTPAAPWGKGRPAAGRAPSTSL